MASPSFAIEASGDLVQGWASSRLPFEPNRAMLAYRAALRAGLSHLDALLGTFLDARYTGPPERACDVENVLVYNVGHAAFAHLHLAGLSLVRSAGPPPPPPESAGISMPHHHRYQLHPEQRTRAPTGRVVAEWHDVPFRLPLAVEAVWYALRTSPSLQVREGGEGAHLGLDVEIGRPVSDQRALLGLIKVLVDWLVSALHAHDGRDVDVVTERLGSRIGVEASVLSDLLLDDQLAVLGTRRLLWPYRQFVQWNPADDAIVDLRLTTTPAAAWTTSGTVRSLTAP